MAAFWGVPAPPRMPTLSGQDIEDDDVIKTNFSGHESHRDFTTFVLDHFHCTVKSSPGHIRC